MISVQPQLFLWHISERIVLWSCHNVMQLCKEAVMDGAAQAIIELAGNREPMTMCGYSFHMQGSSLPWDLKAQQKNKTVLADGYYN